MQTFHICIHRREGDILKAFQQGKDFKEELKTILDDARKNADHHLLDFADDLRINVEKVESRSQELRKIREVRIAEKAGENAVNSEGDSHGIAFLISKH